MNMPLAQNDYDAIGEYVRRNLGAWLQEQSLSKPPHVYEIELRERMVRVEEELKNQRDLMKQGFDLMDKRFEEMNKRFEEMREDMNMRFQQVDRRFEEMREDMNARFQQVDKRFESLTKRIDRFMVWSFGLSVTMAGVIIAVLKLT
jgi:ABC-type phosphate transport system auxiliary subunit